MNRYLFFLIFCINMITNTMAQKLNASVYRSESRYLANFELADDVLVPYRVGELFGYMNKDKELVIEPQWQDAFPFRHGVAAVGKHFYKKGAYEVDTTTLYALINTQGELLTDYSYRTIKPFDANGLGKTKHISGYWGALNTKGEEQIPMGFKEIYYQQTGIYKVKYDGKASFIDKNAKVVFPIEYDDVSLCRDLDSYMVEKDGKQAYYDADFKPITGFDYKANRLDAGFMFGMARVHKGDQTMIINKKGEVLVNITEMGYERCGILAKDFIVVSIKHPDPKNFEDHYKTYKGIMRASTKELIIDPKKMEYYSIGTLYTEDVAPPLFIFINTDYMLGDSRRKIGLMDTEGKIVLPAVYDLITSTYLNNGIFLLENKYGPYSYDNYFYDSKSLEKIGPIKGGVHALSMPSDIGLTVFVQTIMDGDEKYSGIIGLDGKEMIPPKYDRFKGFDEQVFASEGIFYVVHNGLKFYVDAFGYEYKK
ncbi:WG repeat-containing protein [Persicobacter psychrovividus]|uniref:WG repeat-containing protein n=1 Tax=Persicobacter psychrovividus TaxID=387638 RepID=A0ABM7VJW2_9BACT|nr:hypothetical protein PEPS_35690 [Persicobacter psychrovividus]